MNKLIKSPKQINQCKYFVCIWIGQTAMISNLKKKKKAGGGLLFLPDKWTCILSFY